MENRLKEVAGVFLKLGTIAFGGPAAHIAMMENEIVTKRKWISREHFIDLIGATNLIPGPNSTEMTMHCGYERAGIKGLIVAGTLFIMPAVFITGILAWLYSKYGDVPALEPYLYGIKAAVISIIAVAVYKLGQKALKNKELMLLAAATVAACALGVNEIIAMFGAGLAGVLVYLIRTSGTTALFAPVLLTTGMSKSGIFFVFLKVGAILYGSGYVLFAFLDAELVSKGLLSRQELMDAVAIGQFTPGPVLSTATFIGWQLGGFWGAMAATLGIFLPSFAFVGLLNPLIPRMRKSKGLSAFLDAINAASIAVIFWVCVQMGIDTLNDWRTILIMLLSFAILWKYNKINAAWVVVGGAVLGFVLSLI